MTESSPQPFFLADSRALDFLNTLAVLDEKEVEWLSDGEQLLDWLEAAGLIDSRVRGEVRALAKPGELDAVASQARGLRKWLLDFVGRHRGKPLNRNVMTELEPLNRLLARDEQFAQIALRPKGALDESNLALRLVPQRQWRAVDALLLPIADAIAQLMTTADFTLVKRCEGPTCVLHFLDTSRDHRRRWCCMAVCGNRAKQAAYRNRKAAAN